MIQEIKMNPELMDLIEQRFKTATTRRGIKKYHLGDVRFVNNENPGDFIDDRTINKIELIAFGDINNDLAKLENYKGSNALKQALEDIYGEIDESEPMTVVYFD